MKGCLKDVVFPASEGNTQFEVMVDVIQNLI